MQKYFIYVNHIQVGPLSLDELQEYKISRSSLIWHEGLSDWKEASELEELAFLIKSIPPEIPVKNNFERYDEIELHNSESRKVWYLYGVVGALVIIGFWVYSQRSHKLQMANIKYQLEEQQEKIKKQEAIEIARQIEEERQRQIENEAQRKRNYNTLISDLEASTINLQAAELKLNDIQGFHFLRTESEKEEQILNQLKLIENYKKRIRKIENKLSVF